MMLQPWKPIELQDRALGNGFSTSSIGQISFSPETMVDVADETHIWDHTIGVFHVREMLKSPCPWGHAQFQKPELGMV